MEDDVKFNNLHLEWLRGVIEASNERLKGRDAECRRWQSSLGWKPISSAPFDGFSTDYEYRAKPIPQYRPFTLEESGRAVGRIVNRASNQPHNRTARIVGTEFLHDESWGFQVRWLSNNNEVGWTAEALCREFVFADTSLPCGVLVEVQP